MKEVMKMNPLLVSSGNFEWTETGRKNLENLSESFGCDILLFQPNRKLAKKVLKKAFEDLVLLVGIWIISYMHYLIEWH